LEFPAVAFQCSRQSNKHHICLGRLPRGSACAYLQSGILHRNCITWYAWMANGLRKVQGWCHEVMRNVVSSSWQPISSIVFEQRPSGLYQQNGIHNLFVIVTLCVIQHPAIWHSFLAVVTRSQLQTGSCFWGTIPS
jgi:hypothetical protein